MQESARTAVSSAGVPARRRLSAGQELLRGNSMMAGMRGSGGNYSGGNRPLSPGAAAGGSSSSTRPSTAGGNYTAFRHSYDGGGLSNFGGGGGGSSSSGHYSAGPGGSRGVNFGNNNYHRGGANSNSSYSRGVSSASNHGMTSQTGSPGRPNSANATSGAWTKKVTQPPIVSQAAVTGPSAANPLAVLGEKERSSQLQLQRGRSAGLERSGSSGFGQANHNLGRISSGNVAGSGRNSSGNGAGVSNYLPGQPRAAWGAEKTSGDPAGLSAQGRGIIDSSSGNAAGAANRDSRDSNHQRGGLPASSSSSLPAIDAGAG